MKERAARLNIQVKPGAGKKAGRLVMDFEDNRLLSPLFGQHDQHLARLEQGLGVTIISRGNRVSIEGPPASCEQTRAILTDLYTRLKGGDSIDQGDVDGAIRMTETDLSAAEDANDAAPETKGLKIATRRRVITPRAPAQADYVTKMMHHELVLGVGPAGTGKTYLAVAMAVSKMLAGEVDRIVLSRPAVEAGESLGFLPGDLKEKVDPYLRPLYDALYDMLPAEQVDKRLATGQIEIAPLAYMRGRTLANAFIILDEAQNTTPMQMKMFLTRFGENSRMVAAGDPSQVDLPAGTTSGLLQALDILDAVDGIAVCRFTDADVVRHPLVGRIVRAYDKRDARDARDGRTARPRSRRSP